MPWTRAHTEHSGIGVGLQLHSDDGIGAQLPGLILGLLDQLGPLSAPRVKLRREVEFLFTLFAGPRILANF